MLVGIFSYGGFCSMAWKRGLFLVLLLLSGCFQEAGEALQPADNTAVPLPLDAPTTSSIDETPDEPADVTTRFPATATFPPITVISPSTLVPARATSQVDIAPSESSQTVGTTPTQPQFITPGGPSGPVPTNTPMPTVQAGTIAATPSGLITPTAPSTGSEDGCIYTVQPGDNMFRIAVNHNVTLDEMRQANPDLVGEAPILQPGQQLQIPGCGGGTTASSDTASTPVPSAPDTGSGNTTTGTGTTYTVAAGDTLYSIARQFGVTVQAIVNANNLSNPNSLSVGQTLTIPPAS
jgi:LysM repeat protein